MSNAFSIRPGMTLHRCEKCGRLADPASPVLDALRRSGGVLPLVAPPPRLGFDENEPKGCVRCMNGDGDA